MNHINVAIDGPSGAGKSTIARRAAAETGMIYVDTGAMYRCVGLYALRNGISPDSESEVSAVLPDIKLSIEYSDGSQRMILNGEDVSDEIRTDEVSRYASAVSALLPVRNFLFCTQRVLAADNSVIMDGRDIGTVILPDAELKIFLTASPETRAMRRFREYSSKGIDISYETVLASTIERDKNDSEREIAPLKPADDAITLDTTSMTLEESVNRVLELIKKTLADRAGNADG